LRGSAPLSNVGKNAHSTKAASSPSSKKKPANTYRDQIAKLQAQLPPIDSQIAELQAALSGKTVASERKYAGVKPDSWQAQVDQLQKKRDGIQSQIDALEDEARRSGVPTNSLP
jgi:prefoldin subunit 5